MHFSSKIDLKSLSAHCEANYWRSQALFRSLFHNAQPACGDYSVITLPDINVALSLNICDVARYTVTYSLKIQSVNSPDDNQPLKFSKGMASIFGSIPMDVRVYHDMQVAEVINFAGHGAGRARYDYPNDEMLQPDEKLQQNALLAQWLSYALSNGVAQDRTFDMATLEHIKSKPTVTPQLTGQQTAEKTGRPARAN